MKNEEEDEPTHATKYVDIESSGQPDVPMFGHEEEPDQATEKITTARDIPVEEDLPACPQTCIP
jgi:hypothetical protein